MGPLGAWLLHPGGGVSGRAAGHFIPDLSFSPSLSPLLQSKDEMRRGSLAEQSVAPCHKPGESSGIQTAFHLCQASGRELFT